MAAKNGHFEIYKFICEGALDKNPVTFNGITPLHLASKNGHLEICEFIAEDVQNIRPMISTISLFQLAAFRSKFRVAKFILENNIENTHQMLRDFFLIYLFHYFLSYIAFFLYFGMRVADPEFPLLLIKLQFIVNFSLISIVHFKSSREFLQINNK